MSIDGIPETLPPIAETAERSGFVTTEPRLAPMRRRTATVLQEEEQLEDAERAMFWMTFYRRGSL